MHRSLLPPTPDSRGAQCDGCRHARPSPLARFPAKRQSSVMQRWPASTPKGAEFTMPTSK